MTDKPTPTDAELEALLLDKLPASKHYIRPVIEKMVAAMQAAIDKWGQPAQAAEPVAREPLTPEQIERDRPMMVEPAAYAAGVRYAEKHHGIKGGQHGPNT